MKRTCAGHCCDGFRLPYRKHELLRALRFKRLFDRFGPSEKLLGWVLDPRKSAGRLFPIRLRVLLEDIEKMALLFYEKPVGTKDWNGNTSTEDNPVMSCVRWDRLTRLCTDYENRPQVCRGYPYGDTCKVKGCEYKGPATA
jgi:Fe-S-cluster containining protein